MAGNPFYNPWASALTGFAEGQFQKKQQQDAQNRQDQLLGRQEYMQNARYQQEQGQKTQQAQFERIKAANAEADKAVSDFDNSANANDPNQLYGQVSQIESMYGLAPGSILGRVRAARGGMTAAPGGMGTPPQGAPLQAPPMPFNDPGSPGNPVDANPVPMPPQQGAPQMPMVPPGPGLPTSRVPPAQPMPSVPPNALQALGARGIGPGGIPSIPQHPGFQMPNPLANGAPGPPQPFGPVPQSPQGSLTLSDMQTPAGSQSWQPAPGPQGQLPQAPFRGPWGTARTGLVPVGTDPIAAAQSAVDRANANLQALSPFAGHATRANAEKAVKDAVTDLTAARRDQLSGQTEFNKLRIASAGGKLPAGTLLDSANDLRPLGYNVNIPMHTIDRGLQPEEWDKIDRVAQAAYDANPKTWQDTQYNGHPLSYYLDENGNRQQIADVDQSQVAQDTHAKTSAQTSLDVARQGAVEAMTNWTTNYKGAVSQAQIDRANAAVTYLQGPKTKETEAMTELINKGRIPEALKMIDNIQSRTDINTGKLNGTLPGSGGSSAAYNKVQAAQASVLGRINSMLKDPITGGSIDPNSLAPAQKAIYTKLQQQNQEYDRQLAGMAKQSGSAGGGGTIGKSVGDLPYAKIDAAARAQGIDGSHYAPLLIAESGGKMLAPNSATARGYAQLTSGTARALGVNSADPDQNLAGGAKYLAQQYARFKSWPLAYAAYNAGPGAVIKYGGIPPFKETQAYVKKIMSMLPPEQGGGSVAPLPVRPPQRQASAGPGRARLNNILGIR